MRHVDNPVRSFASLAVIASLVVFAACGTETDDATLDMPDTTMVQTPDTRPMTTMNDTLEVRLSDGNIDVPMSADEGSRVFRIINDGTQEHGLEVEGMNVSETVAPGEEATVSVQLVAGTYEVFCPVEGHTDERATLQVSPNQGGMMTPGTTTDPGAAGTGQTPQNPGLTQ